MNALGQDSGLRSKSIPFLVTQHSRKLLCGKLKHESKGNNDISFSYLEMVNRKADQGQHIGEEQKRMH